MSPRGGWDPFAPEKPKPRLTWLGKLVVFGGGTTFVVGGLAAGALWFWRPAPQLPALLPAATQAIVLVRPTVRALVGLPMLRRAYPEVFNYPEAMRVRTELQRELGIEIERDVLPWVGTEAGVAFLGRAGGPAGGLAEAGVFGVAARDEAGLEACLTKIADRRALLGDKVEARTHAGTSYRVVRSAHGGRTWSFGRVGGLALATTDEATFQALATRAREPKRHGPSLAQDPAYAAVDRALPRDAVLTGYMAGGDTTGALLAAPGPTQQLVAWMAALRGTGFGLGLRGDGVEVATVVSLDDHKLSPYAKEGLAEFAAPVAPGLIDDAPAGAIAALAFRFPAPARDALAAAWQEQRRKTPAAAGLEQAGLDLERDLLAWLPGDVAVVVLPGTAGSTPLPLDVYLAARPTRPADADAALARIAAAIDRSALAMGLTQAEEQGLRVVRELVSRRVVVAYGRQGAEVRLAIGEGAFGRLTAGGERLGASAPYQPVADRLPRPHAGFFFLDVAAARGAARPYLGTAPTPPAAVARGLESLRAVGGASSPGLSSDGLMRSSMFFHIVEPSQPR